MTPAEARVADFVCAQPSRVTLMSMAHLSTACHTSDPTVMRFCRRLGFSGFQTFKLALAQSLVPSAPFAYEQVTRADAISNIVRKIAVNSINAIERGLADIHPDHIENAANLLDEARWVGIYASGISEITGLDAEHKFQRIGIRCAALIGRNKQSLHADTARPGEVVLVFSQSGHTRQLVETAQRAREGGSHIISVTAANTPLAAVSDALITVSPYEHAEFLTPLTSRLGHNLVLNILVTVIAARRGAEYPDQLLALDSWQTDKI